MADLTVIILTYNEAKNIEACIQSVLNIATRVVVFDSHSTDGTQELAKSLGAEVYERSFTSHADQFTYALNHSQINTTWVLRLDADERISEASQQEIKGALATYQDTEVHGFVIPFEVSFLGKKLKHGGIYPFKKMILFRYGYAAMEHRRMDEHLYLLEGKTKTLKQICYHHDFKDLSTWIDKHNKYSSKEVLDYQERHQLAFANDKLNPLAKIRRTLKYKFYYRLPMGFRAWAYFIYRYIFRLGFLDGKPGLIFAVLQAFWYRFLVDAKLYEAALQRKRESHHET